MYVSNKKLHRIAVVILLFPSVCFTVTQLHSNSFIHNASAVDVRAVLAHLVECDLLICVQRGLKTSRRSTSVYVKRLPANGFNFDVDNEHLTVFSEKLNEFGESHPELTVEEYTKHCAIVVLDATGTATEDLLAIFALPEYAAADTSALRHPIEPGRVCTECRVTGEWIIFRRYRFSDGRHGWGRCALDSRGRMY